MQYREYGLTGKKVSLLGFGGMRFKNINNYDECIHTIITAAEGGINYFDTAPDYCEGKSEKVFGLGFAELRKRNFPYYSATSVFSMESKISRSLKAVSPIYLEISSSSRTWKRSNPSYPTRIDVVMVLPVPCGPISIILRLGINPYFQKQLN